MTRFRSIRALLSFAIGLLIVVILALDLRDIAAGMQQERRARSLGDAARAGDRLFDATETVSIERDLAFSALYTADKDELTDFGASLRKNRGKVDENFAVSLADLKRYPFADVAADLKKTEAQFAALRALRGQIDAALAEPPARRDKNLPKRWFDGATNLIADMQKVWTDFSGHFAAIDPAVNMQMRFKYILGIITEYSGRQRSLIGRLLAENVDPTPAEQADLLRWSGSAGVMWKASGALAQEGGLMPAIAPLLGDAQSHYSTVNDMVHDIFYIPGAHARPYPISAEFWLDMASQANDSLYALKDAALVQSRAYVERLEAKARRAIFYHAAFLLFTLLLCGYTLWVITRRVIGPINIMADALVAASEGKPVPLSAAMDKRRDEIGKLAQALQASQEKTAEIRRYAAALERSNQELDDFAHIASHDLKEPLRGLHRHAEFLIEDNRDKIGPDSMRRLNRLMYISERLERLTGDLLYYSRLGHQDLAIKRADPNAMIADVCRTLDIFLAERHAHVKVPRPLPFITCDATRVAEVFRNLITNAVKYNDALQKTVEIGFIDRKAMPGGAVGEGVFFVRDNGRGIAPKFHKEIFRIFKRLQNAADSAEEGTGAGLTFVKKIVERHGGAIWLESETGKGTTFYFTLNGAAARGGGGDGVIPESPATT